MEAAVSAKLEYFIYGMAFAIGLVAGRAVFTKRDTTDPTNGRSGLTLYRDAETGCEYLKVGLLGGATPRLDATGKPKCGLESTPP